MTDNVMIPETKTLRSILDGSTLYQIPEFQRDYSWNEVQRTDLLKDLLSNLGKQYFFGTIIVVNAKKEGENSVYSLIDGQQRLTTFVIFLQVIRDLIIEARREINPDAKNKTQFDSLLTKSVTNNVTGDDTVKSVLLNDKLEPILPSRILKIGTFGKKLEPETSEQKSILNVYDDYKSDLSRSNLKSTLTKPGLRSNKIIDGYLVLENPSESDYIEFLSELGKQLVDQSFIVTIRSDSKQFAQTIFKNLNSRGIALNSIDLMKNDLFDVLGYENQGGSIEAVWANILKLTNIESWKLTPEEFFHRFWNLSIHKTTETAASSRKMYESFEKKVNPTKERYQKFLEELQYVAKVYNLFFTVDKSSDFMGIENYFTENGHFEILAYIKFLRQYQPERTLILAVFIAREKELLTNKQFKNILRATAYFRILWKIGNGNTNRVVFFDGLAKKTIFRSVKGF